MEKKDSISVETQIRLCRQRCGSDDVIIYTDRGFSGKNMKRPGYLAMIRDLSEGKIHRVIVYRLDRLSRSVSDFSRMWEIFEKNHVEFSSINEQFDTSTPIGKAMVYIIMTFAQLERETIAERITDNYYARLRTGAWPGGRAPFGFRCARIPSCGRSVPSLEPDENAAAAARIFTLFSAPGATLASVARQLTEEGSSSSLRSAGWDSKSVSRILRSPVYTSADRSVLSYYTDAGIGAVSNPPEEFDGTFSAHLTGRRTSGNTAQNPLSKQILSLTNFPGLVNSGIWLRCQNKLDNRQSAAAAGASSPSWLSGLLKCGACGYALSVKKAGGRRYLCCSGRYNLHVCKIRSMTVSITEVETVIQKEIAILIENSLRILSGGQKRLDTVEKEISSLIRRLPSASDAAMKYINLRIDQLEQEKEALSACRITRDPGLFSRRISFADLTADEKKEAAASLIHHIEIIDRDLHIYWKQSGKTPGF